MPIWSVRLSLGLLPSDAGASLQTNTICQLEAVTMTEERDCSLKAPFSSSLETPPFEFEVRSQTGGCLKPAARVMLLPLQPDCRGRKVKRQTCAARATLGSPVSWSRQAREQQGTVCATWVPRVVSPSCSERRSRLLSSGAEAGTPFALWFPDVATPRYPESIRSL